MNRDPIEQLLTHDDLRELTGFIQPKKIRQSLKKHGIRFIDRRDGWPATTWAAVNAALDGIKQARPNNEEPDLTWMTA